MPTWKDFRSDTVTQPTQEMRQAMMEAEVGDDILGEDPTVRELERLGAEILGKEAGLFVISGTMANQVAIMTATQLGDEILVSEESHIYNLEVGGIAALSGVQVRTLRTDAGRYSLEDVKKAVRPKGIQSPITRVICLENTADLNRGIPLPPEYISEAMDIAHERGLFGYLDGARLFNAAAFFGVPASEICKDVDAVMVCLSKGLSAPVGSVLAGSEAFIEKARWVRQRIGGGMRQAGHMAAPGIIALKQMVARLPEDHEKAKRLVKGLQSIDPSLVVPGSGQTNVVQLDFSRFQKTALSIAQDLLQRGIKVKVIGEWTCRMITHRCVTEQDVDEAVEEIRNVLLG